jgi:Lon protease-like protein
LAVHSSNHPSLHHNDDDDDSDADAENDSDDSSSTNYNQHYESPIQNEENSDSDSNWCLLEAMEQEKDPIRKQQLRMNIVRTLQNSLYNPPSPVVGPPSSSQSSSSATTTTTAFTNAPTVRNGGIIPNLPLWRVQWTEVVGRTNVLLVHEPIYTHMFEEIIRASSSSSSPQPDAPPSSHPCMLFGHLYLPNGSTHLRSQEPTYKLQSWQEYTASSFSISLSSRIRTSSANDDDADHHDHHGRACVLGTLMQITDYRRMKDGQLLLLVQALDRFVITQVHQQVPYGVAGVQLLPDIEELNLSTFLPPHHDDGDGDDDDHIAIMTEHMVRPARTHAIVNESWQRWYPYEYASTAALPLPITNQQNQLSFMDIAGCALAKVLPFAPFDPLKLPWSIPIATTTHATVVTTTSTTSIPPILYDTFEYSTREEHGELQPSSKSPLEVALLEAGILSEDVPIPESIRNIDSLMELEIRLWLVLNDFFLQRHSTGTRSDGGGSSSSSSARIPPVVLGLLPTPSASFSWPKGFLLEGIATVMERDPNTNFVRVPPEYPALRRQKRFSYCAAQLLECHDPNNVEAFRTSLLQIPSTKLRLAFVLSTFEKLPMKIN